MSKKRNRNEIRKLRAKIEILKSQVPQEVVRQIDLNPLFVEKKIDTFSKISTVQALDMTGFVLRDFKRSVLISMLLFGIITTLYLFGNNLFNNF